VQETWIADENLSGGYVGISEILIQIDNEIAQLQRASSLLSGSTETTSKRKPGRPKKAASAVATDAKPVKKKRNLTPEGRKRIAEAVKRRWAAQKKATSPR
jgi:hypothetical protein